MNDQRERNVIMAGLSKLFYEGPNSDYFRFYGLCDLCHYDAILPL